MNELYTMASIVFFLLVAVSGCGQKKTFEDKGLSYKEASEKLNVGLPHEVDDVFLLEKSSGMQQYEFFMRFTLTGKNWNKLASIMDKISKEMQRGKGGFYENYKSPIDVDDMPRMMKGVDWWNPQKINNGYSYGNNRSFGPVFWVDEDNFLVYVYTGD